jgi:hypothetical protein
MLAKSRTRVPDHTSSRINQEIRRRTELNIAYFAGAGREAIDQRLAELENEWDIERMIETNASTLVLVGVMLGATVNRKWLILPGMVAGFLLQHALQGWCPPIPMLRRLGFRTPSEIEFERMALKALRGDLEGLPARAQSVQELGSLMDSLQS